MLFKLVIAFANFVFSLVIESYRAKYMTIKKKRLLQIVHIHSVILQFTYYIAPIPQNPLKPLNLEKLLRVPKNP